MANKKTALKRAKKEAARRAAMLGSAQNAPEPIRGRTQDLILLDDAQPGMLPPTGSDDPEPS